MKVERRKWIKTEKDEVIRKWRFRTLERRKMRNLQAHATRDIRYLIWFHSSILQTCFLETQLVIHFALCISLHETTLFWTLDDEALRLYMEAGDDVKIRYPTDCLIRLYVSSCPVKRLKRFIKEPRNQAGAKNHKMQMFPVTTETEDLVNFSASPIIPKGFRKSWDNVESTE